MTVDASRSCLGLVTCVGSATPADSGCEGSRDRERSMAAAVVHAPSTVHRIWKAFGLQPHRTGLGERTSIRRARRTNCDDAHRKPPAPHGVTPSGMIKNSASFPLAHLPTPETLAHAPDISAPVSFSVFVCAVEGARIPWWSSGIGGVVWGQAAHSAGLALHVSTDTGAASGDTGADMSGAWASVSGAGR